MSSLFSMSDLFALSDSSELNFIVKDNTMNDISENIFDDAMMLLRMNVISDGQTLLRGASMGKGPTSWSDTSYRGDETCWITPQLCKDLKLKSFSIFVQRLIKECNVFRGHQFLNLQHDYSVQFAVYVCPLIPFHCLLMDSKAINLTSIKATWI